MLERLVFAAIAAGGPPRDHGHGQGHDASVAAEIGAEFPTVTLVCSGRSEVDERCVTVDLAAWAAPFADTGPLDRRVEAAHAQGAFGLRVVGAAAARACAEILTRYQRFLGRRNRASNGALFDRVLARHRALHDLALPFVQAGFDHAIDTWQWLLRLEPDAGLAVQAAALFRDVERLEADALARFGRRSSSHGAFQDPGARRGAAIARAILAGAGVGAPALDRVAALVEPHERPGDDPELTLLDEAAALSFLAQDSAGFVDACGSERARAKIGRALRRLGPRGRGRLRSIRYRPDVRALVLLELGGETSQPVA